MVLLRKQFLVLLSFLLDLKEEFETVAQINEKFDGTFSKQFKLLINRFSSFMVSEYVCAVRMYRNN